MGDAAHSLTIAKLRRAKEIMERNRAPFSDQAFITAKQWASLGGRPDIWDALPEVDGAPGHRYLDGRAYAR